MVLRTQIWALGVLMAPGVSLRLCPLRGLSWETRVYLLTLHEHIPLFTSVSIRDTS